ncbi:toll/interleukin-1 receptor domain-containing protein [Arthrobacter sp. RCC_34]|uniref:toll/interleukin-1 receptor domain-containing protein n=1 Tax=Arthrobacter sp. RCC_34 TaxID=3239230 RepID=UPI0035240DC9
MLYDVFISHASEDKESFVRPLAERLRNAHIEVWYDEFSLRVGNSLRRSIDRGLAQSRFGIVVLSPHFFEKQWSQWELDGLVSRQLGGSDDVILPIWLDLTREQVLAYSPPLADRLALSADSDLNDIVARLVDVIRPKGSTLVVARDFLIEKGFVPPVVTDDWWLDVAATAESNDMEGTWQEAMGWGRWGFPLPDFTSEPTERGVRLGWAALQMQWLLAAEERPITQITPPSEVLEFIETHIGLGDMCADHIDYLITYAPQLTITGFGGRFESAIEAAYQRSIAWSEQQVAKGSSFGTAITSDGRVPRCSEGFALHDPNFGGYEPIHVACAFVQGHAVANGPPVKFYDYIDYLAWLLSSNSEWLGPQVRAILTEGMASWGVWIQDMTYRDADEENHEIDREIAGKFGELVSEAESLDEFQVTNEARRDLVQRLGLSVRRLSLAESADELASRVIAPKFLHHLFAHREKRRARKMKRK